MTGNGTRASGVGATDRKEHPGAAARRWLQRDPMVSKEIHGSPTLVAGGNRHCRQSRHGGRGFFCPTGTRVGHECLGRFLVWWAGMAMALEVLAHPMLPPGSD
jgi:hypothetical protein